MGAKLAGALSGLGTLKDFGYREEVCTVPGLVLDHCTEARATTPRARVTRELGSGPWPNGRF